jgi:hypothetical protein
VAGANGQDASDRNYGGSKSSGRSGGWGAPATTANNAGFVIIGGVLTAVATGIGGPIAGTVVGTAFAAASQSLPNDSNNNKEVAPGTIQTLVEWLGNAAGKSL